MPAFRSMCTEKILKTELFERDSVSDRLFLKYKSKMTAIVAFLFFFAFSLHFQSETSVFRFLRRSKFKMEVPRLFG